MKSAPYVGQAATYRFGGSLYGYVVTEVSPTAQRVTLTALDFPDTAAGLHTYQPSELLSLLVRGKEIEARRMRNGTYACQGHPVTFGTAQVGINEDWDYV